MNRFCEFTSILLFGSCLGFIGVGSILLNKMDAQKKVAIDVAAQQNATINAQHGTIVQQQKDIDDLTAELTRVYALAGQSEMSRQRKAQTMMLTDVRLNQCEVAAKKLAAQQGELPAGAQSAVAMLLKAFLR